MSDFSELWDAHWFWSKGILITDVVETDIAKYYISDVPGPYFNLCVPKTTEPSKFDLAEVNSFFEKDNKQTSIVLFEKHQNSGFIEHAVRNGLEFGGNDSWVLFDVSKPVDKPGADVVEVTPETFSAYYSVLSKVFTDFPGNEKYLDICKRTIEGSLTNPNVPDLVSKLFVIYEEGVPVAGGGLFYSKSLNVAYLHDGGTLAEYRGKGYQSALLRHRTEVALSLGISRIYSSVDLGGKSWSNCIKSGFMQFHNSMMFLGKEGNKG